MHVIFTDFEICRSKNVVASKAIIRYVVIVILKKELKTVMKKYFYLSLLFWFCFIAGFSIVRVLKPPKISVIMSTYNREDLLPRAIDSILNQTYKDFEFIIINDGSDDKTAEILKNYAKKDKRIIVLNNKHNKGLIYSLNRGLEIARGTYIARMDDDDLSLPERFAFQINYMDEHPNITVVGTAVYLGNVDTQKYTTGGSADTKETNIISYIQVPVIHPTAFIRHDFIKKHQIRYNPEYPSAEDTHFWYLIGRKGGKIINISEPLLVYQQTSKKFGDYHYQQARSYESFLQESLAPFMQTNGLSFPPNPKQTCRILRHMEKTAQTKSVDFDIDTLKRLIKQRNCASLENETNE